MIALKKMYGDELLRLVLVLSLLKTDPGDYQQESLLITQGLSANGSDWSAQQEPRAMLRPTYLHPKSLDHTLMEYERWLFEELHSLGRYHDRLTRERDERMSNRNIHTYLVNNVATESAGPQSLDDGLEEHDGVSDDSNVAHEVKVSYESEDEPEDATEAPSDAPQLPPELQPELKEHPELLQPEPKEQPPITVTPAVLHNRTQDDIFSDIRSPDTARPPPEHPELNEQSPITVAPAVLHNRTQDDIFTDIRSRIFDVSEFLVTPSAMPIKREPEAADAKAEREDLSEDAIYDFVPYFAEHSGSILQQAAADLRDYDETLETLREFRSQLEWLDVKQQEELDLEQYLLENQPLEYEGMYGSDPMLEEKLVPVVKRERASASTSDASSSGVSEMEQCGTETALVKSEPEGDELTQEDMDLIEVLWKQDVDMGFSLDPPALHPLDDELVTKLDSAKLDLDVTKDAAKAKASKEQEDIEKVKADLLEPEPKQDPWAGLSYTVDTETGEYILQGELPSELVSPDSRFDLLEEALQLVQLEPDRSTDDHVAQPQTERALEGAEPEAAAEAPAVGDMLHPGMARHHPHHPHHPLAAYHHQSIMRQMSAEQRWQDLATLLTTPEQQYHHQHYHNIGGGGYAAHAHNAHYAALAPPPPLADKPDNYGAAPTLDGGYKVEQPHHHDALYYQGGGAADIAPNPDGLLQSLLSDDDLNLMDMAMNEGMYTMRMLDGGAPHAAHATHATHATHAAPPAPHMITHLPHERESLSDSAVSSMGSERVASLSDGEWCDAGSDSAQDLHSSKFRPYDASMCRGNASNERAPPQKKHHMFGKRCFQDSSPTESVERPLVKYEYPEQPYLHERHQHVSSAAHVADRRAEVPVAYRPEYGVRGASSLQHAPHPAMPLAQPALGLHQIPSPHPLCGGGAPGYTYGTPERVRHNHTYSAPHQAHDSRQPALRDKRVRRLTDGSLSDSGAGCSRDEKRARALGVPLPVRDIIDLPMDEFNERLSKHDLSEAQLSLIRDIRRRGKNKVAAQNCRKRKLDQITSLADEVRTVRDRKLRLQRDHQSLLAERQRVKDRFAALYRHVFQNLRDETGRPVSAAQYSLQQAADGNVVLVPKLQPDPHMNRSPDDDLDRKKHYDQ